jgi:hypothetical protein
MGSVLEQLRRSYKTCWTWKQLWLQSRALVTTPAGEVIHKQRLVAMPTMSNDRLQRIAQGTQHGDKDAAPAKEMEGGKTRAIELGSRVLVKREMLRQDGKAKPHLD